MVRVFWYHLLNVVCLLLIQIEVKTLTEHLESTKQELASEKQKTHLLEQQLAHLRAPGTAPGTIRPGSSGKRASGVDGGGVSEALAEKVATLEMKELNERQRAELATVR